MKKLFLSAALVVAFSLTSFAGENLDSKREDVKISCNSEEFQQLTSSIATNFKNGSSVTSIFFKNDFKECHVTIKGTINGKPINVDITFTSDSGSCIKDTVKILEEVAASR
ncbi:hypothetical protein [Flavobacterium sp. Arc2]|uniref:hypothetical protein n=1 Tax=Flavobacterium sp. Arc2 TaxID=3046685 RepID=UPI00352D4595